MISLRDIKVGTRILCVYEDPKAYNTDYEYGTVYRISAVDEAGIYIKHASYHTNGALYYLLDPADLRDDNPHHANFVLVKDTQDTAEIESFIADHADLGVELLYTHNDLEDAKTAFYENYEGCYDSFADFAEEITDISMIPDHLASYIDFASLGYDMTLSGEYYSIETGSNEIHIFRAV